MNTKLVNRNTRVAQMSSHRVTIETLILSAICLSISSLTEAVESKMLPGKIVATSRCCAITTYPSPRSAASVPGRVYEMYAIGKAEHCAVALYGKPLYAVYSNAGVLCLNPTKDSVSLVRDVTIEARIGVAGKGLHFYCVRPSVGRYCKVHPDLQWIVGQFKEQAESVELDKENAVERIACRDCALEVITARERSADSPRVIAIRLRSRHTNLDIDGVLLNYRAAKCCSSVGVTDISLLGNHLAEMSADWKNAGTLKRLLPAGRATYVQIATDLRDERHQAATLLESLAVSPSSADCVDDLLEHFEEGIRYSVPSSVESVLDSCSSCIHIHGWSDVAEVSCVGRDPVVYPGVDPLTVRARLDMVAGRWRVKLVVDWLRFIASSSRYSDQCRAKAIDCMARLAGFGWGSEARRRIDRLRLSEGVLNEALASAAVHARCATSADIDLLVHVLLSKNAEFIRRLTALEALLVIGNKQVMREHVEEAMGYIESSPAEQASQIANRCLFAMPLHPTGRQALFSSLSRSPSTSPPSLREKLVRLLLAFYEDSESECDQPYDSSVTALRKNVLLGVGGNELALTARLLALDSERIGEEFDSEVIRAALLRKDRGLWDVVENDYFGRGYSVADHLGIVEQLAGEVSRERRLQVLKMLVKMPPRRLCDPQGFEAKRRIARSWATSREDTEILSLCEQLIKVVSNPFVR